MSDNPWERPYRLQFVYEADMNPDYISHYCTYPKVIAVARLDGYSIGFFGSSYKWDGAVATPVESSGKTMWGVIYKLTFSDADKLDTSRDVRWNGCGEYFLCPHQVTDTSGNIHWVLVYKKDIMGSPQMPSSGYADCIVQGARFHCLPQSYISDLMNIKTKKTSYVVPVFGKFDSLSTECTGCGTGG
jgi:gamma-glutamylcyclotransferase